MESTVNKSSQIIINLLPKRQPINEVNLQLKRS